MRPFDQKFKPVAQETLERGIPYVSQLFRIYNYAWGIVAESYRDEIIENRVGARLVSGLFEYQDRVYGKVSFRRHASRFQVGLAYILSYGWIFILIYLFFYIVHDFVLFREFAQAKRG